MKKRKIEVPLQNGKELKPIMIKPNMGRIIKPMAKFPDLSGDGKVTKKDILMGRGVIDKPKMQKNNQKFFDDKGNEITMLDNVDKEGLSTQKSVKRMFKAFKGAGGDIGGFRSTDITTGNFSKLMKDKKFKKAAEQNPYYEGLKKAFVENRGFGKPNMKKDTPERLQIKKTGRDLQNALNKEKSKPMTEQDKRVINQLQGAIEEQKKKLKTNKTKPTMIKKKAKMTKPKMFSGTGSAKMTAKQKLAAAKAAKKAPGKAVRAARKGVKTENKNKRVAARATAKTARKATRATNLKGRIENKKARVTKRVTKSRATNKLDKLTKPAMKKPMLSKKPKMAKKPMMGKKKPMMMKKKK